MELEILELETTKANPEVEMEEIQIKRIDLLKDALASANEEKTVVIEKYEQIESKIAEGKNEFAEKLEEHKEVTNDHVHRVEQASQASNEEL